MSPEQRRRILATAFGAHDYGRYLIARADEYAHDDQWRQVRAARIGAMACEQLEICVRALARL